MRLFKIPQTCTAIKRTGILIVAQLLLLICSGQTPASKHLKPDSGNVVYVGGVDQAHIKLNLSEFKALSRIKSLQNCPVISFAVSRPVLGEISEIIVKGNRFNAEVVSLTKDVKTGNKITIDEIKVTCPDGKTKTVNGVTIEIL